MRQLKSSQTLISLQSWIMFALCCSYCSQPTLWALPGLTQPVSGVVVTTEATHRAPWEV